MVLKDYTVVRLTAVIQENGVNALVVLGMMIVTKVRRARDQEQHILVLVVLAELMQRKKRKPVPVLAPLMEILVVRQENGVLVLVVIGVVLATPVRQGPNQEQFILVLKDHVTLVLKTKPVLVFELLMVLLAVVPTNVIVLAPGTPVRNVWEALVLMSMAEVPVQQVRNV